GRVAAFEIMGSNLRVKDTILQGETEDRTFYDIIEGSQAFGMMTFDQSIADLFRQGLITEEIAMSYASRKAVMGRAIDSIKAERGEKTTDIEGLELDSDYGQDEKPF
ncbi:MAG: twitching motility protein, partial [Deltaproteobacteria bacterium]